LQRSSLQDFGVPGSTKSVLAGPDRPAIAKVQLSGIVGEYVRAQARSATLPEQVTSETRAFMGEVQRNLERRGASGQIVLVGEAVLAGNVPDITADVRREVYTRVKMPQAAAGASTDVMGAMRAAMAGACPASRRARRAGQCSRKLTRNRAQRSPCLHAPTMQSAGW